MQNQKLDTNLPKDPESSDQSNSRSSVKLVKNMFEQKVRSISEAQNSQFISPRKKPVVKKFHDLSKPSSSTNFILLEELQPKTPSTESGIKTDVISKSQSVDDKSSEAIPSREPALGVKASIETTDDSTDVSFSAVGLKPLGPKRGLPNSYKNIRNASEFSGENEIKQNGESSQANQSLNSTINSPSSLDRDKSSMVSISKLELDQIYSWMLKTSKEMEEMKSKIKQLMESCSK